MATFRFWEYSGLAKDSNNYLVPVIEAATLVTSQNITYTTSTASSAFNANTTIVRLKNPSSGSTVYWAVGKSPTATAASEFIEAGETIDIGVEAGDKIAFYDGTS